MSLQSRALVYKTICCPAAVLAYLTSQWPDVRVVWSKHPAEGSTPVHFHGVVVFSSVVRWDKLRAWLMCHDPHSFSDSCRSVTRSIRYLLHLDNPEKVRVPVEDLHSYGFDADELSKNLHGFGRGSVLDYLPAIIRMPVFDALQYCEQQGILFRDVSSALNCMYALDRVKRHVPFGNDFDVSVGGSLGDVFPGASVSDDDFGSLYDFSLEDLALGGTGGDIPL